MHEIFDAPDWWEALTLAERVALLSAEDFAEPLCPERMERAQRRADRWRREADLTDDAIFAERLALDGLTPDRFLRALAEPPASLRGKTDGRPPWLQLLARTFSRPCTETGGDLGVLELLRPLIADADSRVLRELRRLAARGPGLLDAEAVAASLLATLVRRLRWACERTLALELQVSLLEGRLQGETSEERFRSFVEILRRPAEALEILRRYPVLARDACRHAQQWVETSLEMMERLAADRDEIVRRLAAGEDPGPLTAVETGLSDRHDGGRSVAVLAFASGLRAVYKPKPLAVDLRFQELVGWLNERGAEPPLRRLAVLDRGGYGWEEHVAARPCESMAEVARFHERQGAWVALLYVLEANDFHHENLIAEGEHPVPIDLETLFQPARAQPAAGGPGYLPTAQTVLNSGLLPRRFWDTAAEEGGLDLSGMGATGGQTLEVRRIAGEGTDRMRWARQEMRLEAGPNLPTLWGEPVAPGEHGGAVLRGFRAMYQLLQRHREELIAPRGPLSPFAGLPVRTLLRGTGVYVHLLHVAHHPDYLRSALDRDRLYDRLWLDAVGYPPFRRAVRSEREDLAAGDVPLWRAPSTGTDLLHARGERIGEFFATAGLELVQERLRAMGDDDLERQSWLVEASIEATRALDERWAWPATSLPEAGPAGRDRFLAAARKIGDRLARLAVEQGGIVTWFHLDLRPGGWLMEPMPVDLYDGLCGLALFLAHLGALSGEERYERLARLALSTARQRHAAFPEPLPGAFNGWGGLVYTLTHLGRLWGEPGLLDEAVALVAGMPDTISSIMISSIESDGAFDLIAGSAGAAAALLALHRHRPHPAVLEAVVRCGERLLAGAVVDERGAGWPPLGGASRVPLTGFSHGTAGIAWVLARIAQATGEERFRDAARGALRYERSRFDPARDNWPDLRESHRSAAGPDFLYAWCHGAPGIGLGRAGILPYLDDPGIPAEIRAAARATLAEGFGGSQCLCHGDLGNVETVREAGRVLGDAALTAEADRLAARILARIEGGGLRCGTSARTESLGLMVGLAGIGYGLLRAAWPERVPSVLLLETP
jgi:type 2 lantibiotic biosynthesis protein LanM